MTVPFDTNVLLDVLLDRAHAVEGMMLLDAARARQIHGLVIPTILTNAFYVGRRTANANVARSFIPTELVHIIR
ncbi:PIN domain-containing protein [Salisaeta longa]|uniref:PIN domain-containing protein n=1 Tax=Salisaeta longa TaxID=503170 RepID=UPI0003B4C504